MFDNVLSFGGLLNMYSGSPLVAAVSSATCKVNGNLVPCNEAFNFMLPLFVILTPIMFLLTLISLAASVLMIVAWWKVFKKAGRPGWAAIVPIYNLVVMFQIVGMSPWLILLALIPFVGPIALFVVMILVNIKLAKIFGKDDGFAVGLILLPVVFVPILGFGQARFTGVVPTTPVAPVPPQNPPTPPVTPAAGPTATV